MKKPHKITSSKKNGFMKYFLPFLLFGIVISFWAFLNLDIITVTPTYTGEMNVLENLDWASMWRNVYLSTDDYWYYRFSPTALFPISILDRDFYAPLLGISFPSNEFKVASRLTSIGIIGAGLMALAAYFLARTLEFSLSESFLAGLYIGVFKGIGYFFRFASTVEVIPLFVTYVCFTILFFIKFSKSHDWKCLIGYYIFFLLSVGAWEQWVNLLAFIILFSILLMINGRKINKGILVNGIMIPIIVFLIYFITKLPYTKTETSYEGQEAEYVFSYYSIKLMGEDIAVNASHHITDSLESIVLPWPMLSRTVIDGADPAKMNLWNNHFFDRWSNAHYLALSDWYAGIIFGIFCMITILISKYIYKNPNEFYTGGVGLLLIWTGFLAHVLIKFRAYFIVPGFAGMLGYKHMISVLGVALLLSWGYQKIKTIINFRKLKVKNISIDFSKTTIFFGYIGLLVYLISNNYFKVMIAFYLKSRGLPW